MSTETEQDSSTEEASRKKIEVSLLFPAEVDRLRAAEVHLRLLDVSEIDASSRTVAERVFETMDYDPSAESPSLSLVVDEDLLDERADYIIDVRVERGTDSGAILITTQSIPVLTRGYPSKVTVPLTLLPSLESPNQLR